MKSKRSKRDRDERKTPTIGIQTEEPEPRNVDIPPEVVSEDTVEVTIAAEEVVEVLTNRVITVKMQTCYMTYRY